MGKGKRPPSFPHGKRNATLIGEGERIGPEGGNGTYHLPLELKSLFPGEEWLAKEIGKTWHELPGGLSEEFLSDVLSFPSLFREIYLLSLSPEKAELRDKMLRMGYSPTQARDHLKRVSSLGIPSEKERLLLERWDEEKAPLDFSLFLLENGVPLEKTLSPLCEVVSPYVFSHKDEFEIVPFFLLVEEKDLLSWKEFLSSPPYFSWGETSFLVEPQAFFTPEERLRNLGFSLSRVFLLRRGEKRASPFARALRDLRESGYEYNPYLLFWYRVGVSREEAEIKMEKGISPGRFLETHAKRRKEVVNMLGEEIFIREKMRDKNVLNLRLHPRLGERFIYSLPLEICPNCRWMHYEYMTDPKNLPEVVEHFGSRDHIASFYRLRRADWEEAYEMSRRDKEIEERMFSF